jgi:hypothetical protein
MGLTPILEKLYAAGLTIEAIDGRLKITPASRLTAEMMGEIKKHKGDIIAALTSAVPVFESDSPTWLRRQWCRVYRHRYGWRDVYGCDHCLTCVMPSLSAPVAAILEVVGGEVVVHDPFCLPDDMDVMEFVGERAGIRQHDGGLDRLEAERMAALDWWAHQATRKARP